VVTGHGIGNGVLFRRAFVLRNQAETGRPESREESRGARDGAGMTRECFLRPPDGTRRKP
jgi:hypothetical protein